jgi:hypothetical protein
MRLRCMLGDALLKHIGQFNPLLGEAVKENTSRKKVTREFCHEVVDEVTKKRIIKQVMKGAKSQPNLPTQS